VRLSPSLAEARYALGNLRLIQGDTENAVLHLGAAVKFRPDFAEAYLQLGKALEARGQIDRAEQCYSQAARLNPRSADALYHCGMVLVRHEHFDEAAKCVEMALELNPGSAPYKVLLAQILDALSTVQASAGNLAEATSTERRARDLAKATGERELLRLIEEQLKRFERDEISRPATTPATARH
jgi:tetratricopeptide (TPR) repeat protein